MLVKNMAGALLQRKFVNLLEVVLPFEDNFFLNKMEEHFWRAYRSCLV
jgi:hypothetical protein